MRRATATAPASSPVYGALTLLFAYLLLPKGIAYAAAGGNLGSLPGAIAGLAVVLFYARKFQREEQISALYAEEVTGRGSSHAVGRESSWSLVKRILVVAIPVSFSAIASALVGLVDSILVIGRLRTIGVPGPLATAYFGQLNQMAMPFINATVAIASAIGISLVPALASAAVRGARDQLRRIAGQALELTFLFALPATAGLYVLATPLTTVIFRNATAGAALAATSTVTVFWSLQMVTAAALQGILNAGFAMWSLVAGMLVKIILSYVFIPTALGVRASGYATAVGFAISAGINLWRLSLLGIIRPGILARAVRPALAAVVMGILVKLTYNGVFAVTRSTTLALAPAVLAGVVVYGLAALVWGFIDPEQLALLPRIGTRLSAIARRMKRF
jgi:stage V sporulation protein B